MPEKQAARLELVDRITERSADRPSDVQVEAYRRWCAVHDRSPLPGDEASLAEAVRTLSVYVYVNAMERGWNGANTRVVIGRVANWFCSQGCPDPRGSELEGLAQAIRRLTAGQHARPTDALEAHEVAAMFERSNHSLVYPIGSKNTRDAALLGIAAICDTDPLAPDLRQITAADVEERSSGDCRLSFRGSRFVIDQVRHVDAHRAIAQWLGSDTSTPLGDRDTNTRLAAAFRRAGLAAGTAAGGYPRADETRAYWAEASDADRAWIALHAADPHLAKRRQDLALLAVGILTGSRAAELGRIDLGRIQEHAWGYSYSLAPDEHKGGVLALQKGGEARGLTFEIPHDCDQPMCGACVLRDHLEVRRRSLMAGDDAPLFADRVTGVPITRQGINGTLRRLVDCVEGHLAPDERGKRSISNRSLRVTAATLAYLSGMSIAQIASDVTNHRQHATAERYIRALLAYDDNDLVLGLDEAA